MKTTIELPDDLLRSIKVRAAQEDRKLKDLVEELLRRGMAAELGPAKVRRRVELPIIKGGHPAAPGEEMTPDRVAQILMDDEAESLVR